MHRVHVVGVSPRTGTTLLAECMRGCFEIDAWEPHEARVTHIRRDQDLYLTKCPADIHAVGPRLRLDRLFDVVCMLRDPRDVIVSRHARDPTHYWVSLRVWKERWPLLHELSKHSRFHVIRYEDLVRDPDGTQARLEELMPFLVRTQRFSLFSSSASPSEDSLLALGGVRDFETSSIGGWREHLPRVAGQLALHGSITAPLIELGYETDPGWTEALAEVALLPDWA